MKFQHRYKYPYIHMYYSKKYPYIHMYYSKEYRERIDRDPLIWMRRDQSTPILMMEKTNRSFTATQISVYHIDAEAEIIRDISLNITVGANTKWPYVCGFIEHNHEALIEWREAISKSTERITARSIKNKLKWFFSAILYTLKKKLKEIYRHYSYSRY